VLLALLWWALVGDDPGSWYFGVPAIAVAVAVGLALSSKEIHHPVSPLGALRFIPFFLRDSLSGGVDVALRALRPNMPLVPDLLEYDLRVPEGAPRILVENTLSLLPGTLTADVRGRRLYVHTLVEASYVLDELRELEERVADVFGLELEPATDARDGAGDGS
jgi:multicomponent Na+:H+ antiporter subunit E